MTTPGTAPQIEGPVLALETASADAEVAVIDADRVLAEHRWTVAETISRELLAAIDEVLRAADVERDAIAAIAIDAGPGGYTALRAGVATAQGIALALGIPLAGVSRLQVAALPHLTTADHTPLIAVHAAGRDRLAWAAYASAGPHAPPIEVIAPRIDDLEECLRHAPAGARWCGEIPDELRAALGDAQVIEDSATLRAADVARLAHLSAAFADPQTVDVIYLRPPSITRPAGSRA